GLPEQLEHIGHMLDVLFANLLVFRARARVVIALRQAEAALIGFGDFLVSILEILIGAVAEESIDILQVKIGNDWSKLSFALDVCNAIEFRLQRSQALFLDRRFIHARRVKVADLLIDCTALGIVYRSFLKNVAQDETIALGELGVASIGALVRRDRILLQPS